MNEALFNSYFEQATPHGWLSKEEALLLIEAAEKTSGPILEVGCYMGRATMMLARLRRLIYAVDPWDDSFNTERKGDDIFAAFCENVARVEGGQVWPFRCRIEEWLERKVGFAYLDGDHTYKGTLRQIEKALRCDPSVIAIHDVNDSGGGLEVKRAAIELLGPWDKRTERLAVWELSTGQPKMTSSSIETAAEVR